MIGGGSGIINRHLGVSHFRIVCFKMIKYDSTFVFVFSMQCLGVEDRAFQIDRLHA